MIRILHAPIKNTELLRRVKTMREDGVSYENVPERFAGNRLEDPRYEKTYAEFSAAAFGLSAAGFADLDFHRRESPDFEVRSGGVPVSYLEVVTVKEDGDDLYDGLLQQANVALNRRAFGDAHFAQKIASVSCEIVLPLPPNKRTREALVSEVVDFFANESLVVTDATIKRIPERYSLLHAAEARYILVPGRGMSHLAFRSPAQTFSALPVGNAILSRLNQKRIAAAKYEGSPLWLMAYCEVPGTSDALQILESIDVLEIWPYRCVFVGGQRQVLELRQE